MHLVVISYYVYVVYFFVPANNRLPVHVAECAILRLRGAAVTVPWFDRPCAYYDAILPIRVLLLRMSNPKVYRLVTLLMDHNDTVGAATRTRNRPTSTGRTTTTTTATSSSMFPA